MRKQKESEIQASIMKFLRLRGEAWKLSTTGIYDSTRKLFRTNFSKGVPDIVFMSERNGLIFFEVKRPGGKLSPAQKVFKEWCEKSDTNYWVVTSLDEVMLIIDKKLKIEDLASENV